MILSVDDQVYHLPLSQVSDRLAKASEGDEDAIASFIGFAAIASSSSLIDYKLV
jgi:hypothetical protein